MVINGRETVFRLLDESRIVEGQNAASCGTRGTQ